MEYISICIAYPEKFWKAANSYARSKKSWIPAKNIEKLELVIRQTEEKRKGIGTKLFDFAKDKIIQSHKTIIHIGCRPKPRTFESVWNVLSIKHIRPNIKV